MSDTPGGLDLDEVDVATLAGSRWVCPFCPLLCDDLRAVPPPAGAAGDWQLSGGRCWRASAGLAACDGPLATAVPTVDGVACALDVALDMAAATLHAATQALFGGLGTDVQGARALYRLACLTGAVSDAAQGPAMMAALRALQDRGGYTTTLAELRSRADLVVCVGGLPDAAAPRFFERPPGLPARELLQLGGSAPAAGIAHVPGSGDVFATLAELAALLAGRTLRAPDAALQGLAQRLHAARYAVIVAEPGRWQADAGLVVEGINRVVAELNRRGRAAALWLGGGDGAATVNQVFAWLSGLPLRSRAGPGGLEHEPLAWDAERLINQRAIDALLWVSSFSPGLLPPASALAADLPLVVLGHAATVLPARRAPTVIIPVATPGVGCGGHLVRTDGTVLLPLVAARPDQLPTVASVVSAIAERMAGGRHG